MNEKRWSDLSFKNKISYVLCITSFVLGFILIFVGMFIEPQGEISSSVITTFGLCLTFSGALLGIDMAYSSKLSDFKAEVKNFLQENSTGQTRQDEQIETR